MTTKSRAERLRAFVKDKGTVVGHGEPSRAAGSLPDVLEQQRGRPVMARFRSENGATNTRFPARPKTMWPVDV